MKLWATFCQSLVPIYCFLLSSYSHRSNLTYWSRISSDEWAAEMAGMRTIISEHANIPIDDIKGIRAPFLQVCDILASRVFICYFRTV